MDPDTAYRELRSAMDDDRDSDAVGYAEALVTWLDRGGYRPPEAQRINPMRFVSADLALLLIRINHHLGDPDR